MNAAYLHSTLQSRYFLDLTFEFREHLSFKQWIDLLVNVDADVSSGTVSSGWDDTVIKRMARVTFVETALLTANYRTGISVERGFVWTSGSFLPIFETQPLSSLRCLLLAQHRILFHRNS